MGSSISKRTTIHPFLPVPPEDYIFLRATTDFRRSEIDYLYIRFRKLGESHGRKSHIYKNDFHFPSDMHILILNEMFGIHKRITFREFVTFLNLFRQPRFEMTEEEVENRKKQKLKILFNMWDTSKDGVISKFELVDIVHKLFSTTYMRMDTMIQIADSLMEEMDTKHANQITFDDFCKSMELFNMDDLVLDFPRIIFS